MAICQERFYCVHLNLVGPLLTSPCGKRFIAVIIDKLTRDVFTSTLTNKSAMSVTVSLNEFISRFGCLRELVTDQGTEFINQVIKEISNDFNIKHVQVKAYRPFANGLVELMNRVLMNILHIVALDNLDIWPKTLPITTMALNSAFNKSIGNSPHFLVYAQDPYMPLILR